MAGLVAAKHAKAPVGNALFHYWVKLGNDDEGELSLSRRW
jgi:hypothetical protein